MPKNLVIVESPAKAKTIEKFLGKEYKVMSSFGHIADLPSGEMGIDIAHDFKPEYIVSPDKGALVKSLKEAAGKSEVVWLASDEDREGEAISWHLLHELKLDESKTKRIVFNSITKSAIEKAIANPRGIDYNLVDAQQARRVLDRLVGYELSPVLWKKVKTGLSAGRVQSVSVRLIVEREREIKEFTEHFSYKVVGEFYNKDKKVIKARLSENFGTYEQAKSFLENNIKANFAVEDIVTKPGKKSPAAPFTTSTLQQEASRKLGFSVSRTMQVAQRLYESGIITYMRTDSVNLSGEAISAAAREIESFYGKEYSNPRNFSTHSKGAQEAHEAIRPTDMSAHSLSIERDQARLYDLIWKRTIASQMSEAKVEKTQVTIGSDVDSKKFFANGEMVVFDGFLKVYLEGIDDEEEEQEGMLPTMKKGEELKSKEIVATQRFTRPPYRYTEASLVKKLEELGIGRPSTYAPTISTIQQRGYVERSEIQGVEREYRQIKISAGKITESKLKEVTGADKGKLIPTDIGVVVNDFLVSHFENILDYNFTANVEQDFDNIASGKLQWTSMMKDFYKDFHPTVLNVEQNAERESGERVLGVDPKSGRELSVRLGKYGPMAQIGKADDEEKPVYASIPKGQSIETITFEQALKLFELPKNLGDYEGKEVVVNAGRFGPYIKYGETYISLGKDADVEKVGMKEAKVLIMNKMKEDEPIATYDNMPVVKGKGRFGPFIKWNDIFINVNKKYDFDNLTAGDVKELIEDKLKKESEKVVAEWGEIRIEKARWGRYTLIKGNVKIELSKDTNIEAFSKEIAEELIGKHEEKTVKKGGKSSGKVVKKKS